MILLQEPGEEKLLLLKPNVHSFNTTNISFIKIPQRKLHKYMVSRPASALC